MAQEPSPVLPGTVIRLTGNVGHSSELLGILVGTFGLQKQKVVGNYEKWMKPKGHFALCHWALDNSDNWVPSSWRCSRISSEVFSFLNLAFWMPPMNIRNQGCRTASWPWICITIQGGKSEAVIFLSSLKFRHNLEGKALNLSGFWIYARRIQPSTKD